METLPPLAFGTLLRRHRIAAGLTQEELAERALISRRSISDMERGVPHRPRAESVELLAEALGLAAAERCTLVEAAGRLRASAAPGIPVIRTRPPFVGRARDVAALERHLAAEGPPLLLLAGEPGIGKSRLLGAAVARAIGRGWCVLEGGCQRRGGHQPYAPLLGALQQYLRQQHEDRLQEDLHGCAWLIRLLPELADAPIPPLPSWTLPPEQERRLMVDALLRFLTNVAGPAGTLLVLDDLQWANPDALDLLNTVVRFASDIPLRVVGAYRDTEIQPRDALALTLADLTAEGLAARHLLGPLTPYEAAQLLDELLGEVSPPEMALREEVLRRAGGVPFFVVSCAQGLRFGEADEAVPWDLAQSVRQRVAALPDRAQELLRTAAVIGRMVPRALLVGVASWPEEEVLAAFDATGQARLLEESGEDAYQFAHDVIREVVEGDLGTARRRVLHRHVAEVLERRPGEPPVELLAYHYSRSDAVEKAILYLERAGDRAEAQYAHTTAASYYGELVELLDQVGQARCAGPACEKLGSALSLAARYDAALPVLGLALERYRRQGDREGGRRTLAQMGRVHFLRGTIDEGVERIRSLLEPPQSDPSQGLARLYASLAALLYSGNRLTEAVEAARHASTIGYTLGDDTIRAEAEVWRAEALAQLVQMDEATQAAEEGIRLAEATDDLYCLARILGVAGHVEAKKGRGERSRQLHERALEVSQRLGNPSIIAFHAANCAQLAVPLARARAYAELAMESIRPVGTARERVYVMRTLAQIRLLQGEGEPARDFMEECISLAHRTGQLNEVAWGHFSLAEWDLLMGRAEAARDTLASVLDLPPFKSDRWLTPRLLVQLVWAYLKTGDIDQAQSRLAALLALSDPAFNPLLHALQVTVEGGLLRHQGRWNEAERVFQHALDLARAMPWPFGEARVLRECGALLALDGNQDQAHRHLEEALQIYRWLGAPLYVRWVEHTLEELSQSRRNPLPEPKKR